MIMKNHSSTQEKSGHCHQIFCPKQVYQAVNQLVHQLPVLLTVTSPLSALMDTQQAIRHFQTVNRFVCLFVLNLLEKQYM